MGTPSSTQWVINTLVFGWGRCSLLILSSLRALLECFESNFALFKDLFVVVVVFTYVTAILQLFVYDFLQKVVAQRGARTHDPEIKSLMLYRLS